MIVKTQRSPLRFVLDTLLTVCAWLVFGYIVLHSIMSVYMNYKHEQLPVDTSLGIIVQYLTITVVSALLFVLWAHLRGAKESENGNFDRWVDAGFAAYPKKWWSALKDSRHSVIYHGDDGNIVSVESKDYMHQ